MGKELDKRVAYGDEEDCFPNGHPADAHERVSFDPFRGLPPPSTSRVIEEGSGGWHTTGIHTVTSIVGAGVLGLPFSMSFLTWGGGTVVLVVAWITSLYTLWQLCNMHEWHIDGKWLRMNRYHELARYVLGKTLGNWVLVPQCIVLVGTGIVYMVTAGTSMRRVWLLYKDEDDTRGFGISCWILVFFGAQLILSQVPNLNANTLKAISFLSALMSLSYSTIAAATSISHGRDPSVSNSLRNGSLVVLSASGEGSNDGGDRTAAFAIFGAFNALGTIAFAYGGHSLALEIQATLPKSPTVRRYLGGVWGAYGVITWAYPAVAFAGYWAFGNSVDPNVLVSLAHPRGVVATASLMVTVHMLGAYQLYSMPIYDMVEIIMARHSVPINVWSRLLYRSAYTCFTAFVAILLPFAIIPTNFILPPVFWLIQMKPRPLSMHWLASWLCIVYGIATAVLGSVGGMRNIIVRANQYKVFA